MLVWFYNTPVKEPAYPGFLLYQNLPILKQNKCHKSEPSFKIPENHQLYVTNCAPLLRYCFLYLPSYFLFLCLLFNKTRDQISFAKLLIFKNEETFEDHGKKTKTHHQ